MGMGSREWVWAWGWVVRDGMGLVGIDMSMGMGGLLN